jgi:PTS system nitrogen regulatory IIA component
MLTTSCFDAPLILLDAPGGAIDLALGAAARRAAEHLGLDPSVVESALVREAAQGSAVAVGAGVALPHAALEGIDRPVVVVLRTVAPVDIEPPDGVPIDLLLVALAPRGQAKLHLDLLAHVARLVRSDVLLEGLREARTPADALTLLEATEGRYRASAQEPVAPAETEHALVYIEVMGERAVDRLLVDLVEDGFDQAVVADARRLRDVMADQLPIFASFRTLFDDPGGCRVFFVQCPAAQASGVIRTVRNACEQGQGEQARVVVLPVRSHWTWEPPKAAGRGH